MQNKIIVKDNFLPKEEFNKIKRIMMSDNFPWFYKKSIATNSSLDGIFFVHIFHDNNRINSNYFDLVKPILSLLNIKALIRAKANLYPGENILKEHEEHKDQEFNHCSMLFSLNTCNGYTKFYNGEKVNSIENRAVFFDGSIVHRSTNCSDEKIRMNINFNYF